MSGTPFALEGLPCIGVVHLKQNQGHFCRALTYGPLAMDALFTVVFELAVTITHSEGSTRSALPRCEAGLTSNTYEKRYLSRVQDHV